MGWAQEHGEHDDRGFSILGVGGIAGYVIMLEGLTHDLSCAYDSCNNNNDTVVAGLLIAVASVGVGLGIGIPGILKMARQSEDSGDFAIQMATTGRSWGPMFSLGLLPTSLRTWTFRFFPPRSEPARRQALRVSEQGNAEFADWA